MKVICRMYKTCFYREVCSHSKIHDEIKNTFANDCVKDNIESVFVHGQNITCQCDTVMLRKEKLKKIHEKGR